MKKRSTLGYWTLLMGLLAACKPQPLPEPIEDVPDFYLKGELDQVPLSLEAGIDAYYMYTHFEHERSGVYALRGTLRPTHCTDCPRSLEIEIRDKQVRPENDDPNDIATALATGNYQFGNSVSGAGSLMEVRFQNESIGQEPFQYHWTFGDGTEAFTANPVHYYNPALGQVEVCLEALDANGCGTLVCNIINLDPNACQADFTFAPEALQGPQSRTILFDSKEKGIQPFIHRWDFGDGFIGTLGNPRYTYADVDLYQVTLNLIDSTGCRSSMVKFVPTDPNACAHNFSYEVKAVNPIDTLQLGQVRVTWWDASGIEYRSDWMDQTSENYFRVREVLSYQDNENEYPTRRLRLELDCLLSNGTESIRLTQANAFWGFALPRE